MTLNYKTQLFAFLLLAAGTACTSEIDKGTTKAGSPAEIVGTIGTAPVETRAEMRGDDAISYSKFENGDAIGFFSTGGLALQNKKLTYNGGSFKSEEGNNALIWTEGNAANVYAYYPYPTSNLEGTDYQINIWREADQSSSRWKEGFEDLLAASPTGSVPNGSLIGLTFKHQFAMLILERGTGFETGTGDVTVKLNQKVSKQARIVRETNGAISGIRLQKDGTTSGVETVIGNTGTYAGHDCYYVLIPVGDVYDGDTKEAALTVSSITLKNNADIDITVPFSISKLKLESNWKYRIIIKMRDNQVVIEPEEIRRWDEESVEIVEPKGISNVIGLNKWLAAYNDSQGDRENVLGEFGTKDKEGKWTFLLLDNIEINDQHALSVTTAVITDFKDILDGQGHTLTGLKLSGTANVGFFGILSGEVKNLQLKDIQVSTKETPGSNFGGIAGQVTATGKIENCHILGNSSMIIGAANTGGLAGELVSGGTINNSTSSAMVTGTTGSTGLLVGSGGDTGVTNCTSTGTVITND